MITPEQFEQLRAAIVVLVIAIILCAAGVIKTWGDGAKARQDLQNASKKLSEKSQEIDNNAKQAEIDKDRFLLKLASDLKGEVDKVRDDCDEKIDELKGKVQTAESNLEQKSREFEAKVQEVEGLKLVNEGLQSQLEIRTEQNETLIQQSAELLKANQSLQTQHEADDTALKTAREKNGHLERQVGEMQAEIDKLKDRVRTLETTKPDTGKLDPSRVPDVDPALKPPEAPTAPVLPADPPSE